jgi:hypothetical protein
MAFEGIVYPELVVLDLAQIAVTNFRVNPQVLEWTLAARPPADRDSLLTAIQKLRPGKVRHGVSLDQEEDWQVNVMLASTDSQPRTIGDDIGEQEEVEQFATTLIASIDDQPMIPLALAAFDPSLVPPRGRLRLDKELATYWVEGTEVFLSNRGVQGTRAEFHLDGTPVIFHVLEQQIGWNELVQVRVDVLSSLAGLNMALATTIKAALVLSRQAFEDRGLTLKNITESEITPRPGQWPVYLLNRTLMVQVIREFALPERVPILTDVAVEVTDP